MLELALYVEQFPSQRIPVGRAVSGTVTLLLLVGLGIGRARIGSRDISLTVIGTVWIGVAAALASVAIGIAIAGIFGV
jgi:hypothetical protein